MAEVLSYPFMQRALVAGVLVSLLASFYGVFVVQRRLSFLGSGLAHAAFGGVALGLLLNQQPLAVAVPFTLIVAMAITWVRDKTRLGGDTAIGIFFSLSVALGVVFLSLKREYAADAFAYIFGSILAVTNDDLWITGGILLLALGTLRLWGRWAYATFDRDMALTDKLPVQRDDYLLTALIAVTIVVSVKILGIILIAAFLVIPPAAARLVASSFSGMTILSILIGTGSTVAGLFASYFLDIPSGATIILIQGVLFFIAFAIRK